MLPDCKPLLAHAAMPCAEAGLNHKMLRLLLPARALAVQGMAVHGWRHVCFCSSRPVHGTDRVQALLEVLSSSWRRPKAAEGPPSPACWVWIEGLIPAFPPVHQPMPLFLLMRVVPAPANAMLALN